MSAVGDPIYTLTNLYHDEKFSFEYQPDVVQTQEGRLLEAGQIVVYRTLKNQRTMKVHWAEVLKDGTVAPAGNRDAIMSVDTYVKSQLVILNFTPSSDLKHRNRVSEPYRPEAHCIKINDQPYTGIECFSIVALVLVIIGIPIAIAILMTQPCPIL